MDKQYRALFFDADRTLLDFSAAEKKDWKMFLQKIIFPSQKKSENTIWK